MSDTILVLLTALGRTTLWLTALAVVIALVLRIARPSSPTAHRVAWVLVLLVGWTFVRVPLAVPWYEVVSVEPAAFEQSVPAMLPAVIQNETLELPETEPAATVATTPSPLDPPAIAEPLPTTWRFDWPLAALTAWALGIVALLAAWLVGYARFLRSLESRVAADEVYQAQWRELLTAAGVRKQIPLCLADELGPLLCRLPRGYLLVVPERLWRSLDASQRRAILRHELAHYQRGDVWKSMAARLLAVPHWFNPASWWAVRRFDEAAEWACDRAAAGDEAATEYARLLVRLGEVATYATVYGSAARGRPLAARIRRVLIGPTKEDSKMKKIALIAIALCLSGASVVQLRLVAQQPASKDDAAEAEPPAPQRNSEKPNAPTVSPYLKLLQEQSADEAVDAKPADSTAAQKMVDEARGAYEALVATDAELPPLQSVYDWSLRWMEAAQRVASTKKQKIAAAQAHFDRMRNLAKRVSLLAEAQSHGGETRYLRAANYYVAEAERRVAEIEGLPAAATSKQGNPQDRVATEVQVVDLRIKIAEIKGQIEQTRLEFVAAEEARSIAAQAATSRPGAITRAEFARLKVEPEKLQRRLQTLKEQLSLYEYKLKLLTSRENAKDLPSEEPSLLKSKAAAKPSPADSSPHDKKQTRYEGRDFETWAEQLVNELSPAARAEAIQALGAFGGNGFGPEAAQLILPAIRSCSTDPKNSAAEAEAAYEAFQKIPAKDSLPLLTQALKSDSLNERMFAMNVVASVALHREEVPKLLTPLLKDPQVEMRHAVTNTLLHYVPMTPELVADLRESLKSADPEQVMFAVRAIIGSDREQGKRKRPSDLQLLTNMMPNLLALLGRDEPIKTDARMALLDMRVSGLPALEEAAKSDNEITRRHAEGLLEEFRAKHNAIGSPGASKK
jgi:beta-lactamase regulating signal transducer with metallopeptidase domain